ncbi:MAG: hypothetical protein H6538_01215 [Bacteroidales bacterium]|nr:hypothetical protein [Bacteroidales bacterium]MCB8999828.1 hypothetical protein [Bacteroidales bacterium]
MNRIFTTILLLFSLLQFVSPQIFQEDYKNRSDSVFNKGEFILNLSGSGWFYNNEYFNPFYKGYTLIGADFEPTIIYQSNPKLQLTAGAFLHRYYGDALKTQAKPLFAIEYKPGEKFSVLMGTYKGGENHRLDDILFSFENHLTDLVENGILLRYGGAKIQSETWLNWDSFIFPGDSLREQLVFGNNNKLVLFESSGWRLTSTLCLLAHHAGGQINIKTQPVETLINLGEGIDLSKNIFAKPDNSFFTEIRMYHSLGDFSPSSGMAWSVKSGLRTKHFEVNGQYLRGTDFISFEGNPLLRSYTETGDPASPWVYGGKLEMLNFKAGFRQSIGQNSFLFLRLEGYYFTSSARMDYSYSLQLQVNDFIRIFSPGNYFLK